MRGGLPSEALGVSALVLIYSLVCLKLSSALVCLLVIYGEKSKYVTIFSTFTAISTLASIIQQIYFIGNWKMLKQKHYELTMKSLLRHGLAFENSGEKGDLVLFYIQFYCYNVMCLNLLFWAISLFNSAWASSFPSLGGRHHNLALFSKIMSVIFPAIIIGVLQIPFLQETAILHIISTYATIFLSLGMGSILLILILYQYIKTRRLIAETCNRGSWWGPGESELAIDPGKVSGNYGRVSSFKIWSRKESIYDRALITRFTIGFVIMGVSQIMIIPLLLYRLRTNQIMVKSGKPDMSINGAIVESLLFIPGVSTSLVAFLVFGTTKSFSEYRNLLLCGCSATRRRSNNQKSPYNSWSGIRSFERPLV